ncbi:MAG TPA: alpha/beta hydrolase-fold protein [Gammaproteobacteria bacterium]|nr:alpha/beta hydrolase-fold protein [Gammaproteobacteria bacterium]
MTNLLSSIEINPDKPPIGSVILLHGLGADGSDFVPIISELNLAEHLPLRFVFPHAPSMPVTINNGYVMRAWYDILSFTIEEHADLLGIEASTKKLHDLIQHEESLGVPAEKIILAGFSQGAVIALTTGLTYPKRLGGLLALSGYLLQKESIMEHAAPANQSTPIFLAHGTEDSVVPFKLGESIYHLLKNNNYSVAWHPYRMPHTVCMEEITDIANWLTQIFTVF